MPTHANALPPDIGSLQKQINKLQQQINQLRGAPRLQNASIAGGSLTVTDAGQITCVNTDGTTVFMVGQLYGGDYGTVLNRSDDGSNAIFVGGGDTSTGGEAGVTAIVSRTHNWLASDDPFNAEYGGMPNLQVPMYCVGPNGQPFVSSGTDTGFWIGGFVQERAAMYLGIEISAPASTTIAVHVDVQNTTTLAWTTKASTSVTNTTTVWWPRFLPQQGFATYANVRINASRTSGTGTGTVVPLSCIQNMSVNATEGAAA